MYSNTRNDYMFLHNLVFICLHGIFFLFFIMSVVNGRHPKCVLCKSIILFIVTFTYVSINGTQKSYSRLCI